MNALLRIKSRGTPAIGEITIVSQHIRFDFDACPHSGRHRGPVAGRDLLNMRLSDGFAEILG